MRLLVWSNIASDLRSMAADITRTTGLCFTLILLPFGDDRALFFCRSALEATDVAKCGPVHSQGSVVSLHI